MNTVSHAIVQLVHQYNEIFKSTKACYTFDAGPNACIILPEANLNEFAGLVEAFFPSAKDDYFRGEPIQISKPTIFPLNLSPFVALIEQKATCFTLQITQISNFSCSHTTTRILVCQAMRHADWTGCVQDYLVDIRVQMMM